MEGDFLADCGRFVLVVALLLRSYITFCENEDSQMQSASCGRKRRQAMKSKYRRSPRGHLKHQVGGGSHIPPSKASPLWPFSNEFAFGGMSGCKERSLEEQPLASPSGEFAQMSVQPSFQSRQVGRAFRFGDFGFGFKGDQRKTQSLLGRTILSWKDPGF